MRCNIISDDNGVGLSTDVYLLTEYLTSRGHVVKFAPWDGDSLYNAHVNFYLEKFDVKHLKTAARHVMIPNLEWLDPLWLQYMPLMDQIWAKSVVGYEWLMERGLHNARYTGFLSRDMGITSSDRYAPSRSRPRTAIHVAGKSQAKGTTTVLQAYWLAASLNVELPMLTLVSSIAIDPLPPRVVQYSGYLPTYALQRLMNQATYHMCPSEVEGWGHYIAEGLSCGGVVVTTDHSPMSDHVQESFGVLLSPRRTLRDGFVERVFVDPEQLIDCLVLLDGVSDEVIVGMGERARARWVVSNESFKTKADKLLDRLAASAKAIQS